MTREWQFPPAQRGGQVSRVWVLGTDGWSAMRGPFTDDQRDSATRQAGPSPYETELVLSYLTCRPDIPAAGEDNIGHDGQVLGKVARTQIAVCLIAALVTLAWWPLEVAGLLAAFNGILFAVYTTWRYPDDPAV